MFSDKNPSSALGIIPNNQAWDIGIVSFKSTALGPKMYNVLSAGYTVVTRILSMWISNISKGE
jgi:hypothetical protein